MDKGKGGRDGRKLSAAALCCVLGWQTTGPRLPLENAQLGWSGDGRAVPREGRKQTKFQKARGALWPRSKTAL